MARIENEPVAPTEAVDLTAAVDARTEVPPEILAQSLSEYMRGWWVRLRSGDSGVLPVIVGLVAVAAIFEVTTPENAFLRPSNLVYLFQESTIYMVLAMAEIFILLLGEIDLSIGYVALFGGVVTWRLVQVPSPRGHGGPPSSPRCSSAVWSVRSRGPWYPG